MLFNKGFIAIPLHLGRSGSLGFGGILSFYFWRPADVYHGISGANVCVLTQLHTYQLWENFILDMCVTMYFSWYQPNEVEDTRQRSQIHTRPILTPPKAALSLNRKHLSVTQGGEQRKAHRILDPRWQSRPETIRGEDQICQQKSWNSDYTQNANGKGRRTGKYNWKDFESALRRSSSSQH